MNTALVAAQAATATVINQLAELQTQALRTPTTHDIDLQGIVWHIHGTRGRVILHDASATAELELDFEAASLQPGDVIHIRGLTTVVRLGSVIQLSTLPLVDNDGRHSSQWRSGSIELDAGSHPIRLDWFNAGGEQVLTLDYEGPGIPRQPVPDTSLSRLESARTATSDDSVTATGLDYRYFEEGLWRLPVKFDPASAVATGLVRNFDPSVAKRADNVAIQFYGTVLIPRDGVYTFHIRSDDGARLFLGPPSLTISRTGTAPIDAPKVLRPGELLPAGTRYQPATIQGRISSASAQQGVLHLQIIAGSGRATIELPDPGFPAAPRLLNRTVRATGIARGDLTAEGAVAASTLFVQDSGHLDIIDPAPGSAESTMELPVLETVSQVHQLTPAQLARNPFVRLKGVVMSALPQQGSVVLHDATRGMYVTLDSLGDFASIGDVLEIEGTAASGEFSPFIRAHRLTFLGSGQLPEPIRPTPDQLLNGSLHCQYVEIEGVVTSVQQDVVTLFTRAGKLRLQVEDQPASALRELRNSLVRMRGCLFSRWDRQTRRIIVGTVSLNGAAITIEELPPADLFAGAAKPAAELLQFDPRASPFQRLKLAGQVVHVDEGELFLMDGSQGIRVSTTMPAAVHTGDLVEVVGFPEFSGPSPALLEGEARKTGKQPQPSPKELSPENLLDERHDATLVKVTALLLGAYRDGGHHRLELLSGRQRFIARVQEMPEPPTLEAGSTLALTGVYIALGANRALGQSLASFELALNSSADIQLIARPPWWTLRRLLLILGTLAGVLVAALVWIGLLRRQVVERTNELAKQIRERQHIEQQRAIEQERARLAHDLHDELGAGLTEVSMLGTLARAHSLPAEKKERHLAHLTEIARRLVGTLDEIVWAVNPRYDSVASFLGYYTSYAQRFLGLASIKCRLDVAENLPENQISSGARHGLFLALKETLNNVVRHAQATEVLLRIHVRDSELVVAVSDNGRGLGDLSPEPGMDGLQNTRSRLGALGGRCDISSVPDKGTTIELVLPLR